MKCCENCGWLSVNPCGAMFCGYSEQRTWKDECCVAWKDKDEPQTNADRIRAMTDEELAEWIVHKTEGNGFEGYSESVKAWRDWLRKEADE